MTQKLLLIVIAFMAISMQLSAHFSGKGNGTADEPYKIRTIDHLNEVRNDLSAHYKLMETLDLSEFLDPDGAGWEPIGSAGQEFTGSFNGNNKIIKNLRIDGATEENVGFFGCIGSSAEIRKLGIELAKPENGAGVIGKIAGGLAGTNRGSILSCYVLGDVAGSDIAARVGGLVGSNGGQLQKCYVLGDVMSDKDFSAVGGLVGYNTEHITSCFASGTVTASGPHAKAGGLVGVAHGSVDNCYSTGEVKANNYVVEGGGLIGFSVATVKDCYSLSQVTGDDTFYIGGLIGKCKSGNEPSGCFYFKDGRINKDLYGIGAIFADETVISCDWHSAGASPLNATEMTTMDNFTGWDFSEGDHWSYGFSSENYSPYRRWQKDNFPVPPVSSWFDNEGSEDDPYLIRNAEDLAALNYYLGDRGKDKYFRLTDDIDLEEWLSVDREHSESTKGWLPIGDDISEKYSFEGILDGNGKKITNLWSNREDVNLGLFAYIGENGNIRDLYVELAEQGLIGTNAVGILAGENDGQIIRTSVRGRLTTDDVEEACGGLVGGNQGTIACCYADALITMTNHVSYVGGLVGYNEGTVIYCFATGEIKSEGETSYCGGLIGANLGSVRSCYATGEVTATGEYSACGGLIGVNAGMITSCYSLSTPTVTGENSWAGGLIGGIFLGTPDPSHCFYLKNREVNTDLFGIGVVLHIQDEDFELIPSTAESPGISPLNGLQMTTQNSFTNWDFTNVWTIQAGETAPYFPWQPEPYPVPALIEIEDNGTIYHTITLTLDAAIHCNYAAGELSVAEGDHLYLQFQPEDATRTAADVILLIDGVETTYNIAVDGRGGSYILSPIEGDHTIEIRLREDLLEPDPSPDTTGNAEVNTDAITLSVVGSQLSVRNTGKAVDLAVYSVAGQQVLSQLGFQGTETIHLTPGIYIVRAGTQIFKVGVN